MSMGVGRFFRMPPLVFLFLAAAAWIPSCFLAGTHALSSTNKTPVTLRVAVYQPPIITNPDEKSPSSNPLASLTEVADVLVLASRCEIDLVQFPEVFLNHRMAPLNRDSETLNVVGNLCAQMNVACAMGYAESGHESEDTASPSCYYSSLALFHADGSRAGNYQCLRPPSHGASHDIVFEKGHPLVEAMPITVKLPERAATPTLQESITAQPEPTTASTTTMPREVKLGPMCGGDLLVPEHSRHLANSGAELLAVSGSLLVEDTMVARHVLPTRSLETGLPLLLSNGVDSEEAVERRFVGMSAVLSGDGIEIVRAPETLSGDMPGDGGYFVPCSENGGGLYAADLEIRANSMGVSPSDWDLTPNINQLGESERDKVTAGDKETGIRKQQRRNNAKGFGKEVMEVLERNKKGKLRLKTKQ